MSIPTVAWLEFVDLVQMDLPKCPIPAVIDAVRKATMRFCKDAQVWTLDSSATDMISKQPVYSCAVDDDNIKVCQVLKVWVDGNDITPSSKAEWDSLIKSEARKPLKYRVTIPNLVNLWPTPTETIPGAIVIRVVLQPSRTSTNAPEFLLDEHEEAIAAGAKAFLMLTPDKPWSNPQLASVQWNIFKSKINNARFDEAKGGTVAPLRRTKMGI